MGFLNSIEQGDCFSFLWAFMGTLSDISGQATSALKCCVSTLGCWVELARFDDACCAGSALLSSSTKTKDCHPGRDLAAWRKEGVSESM